jgi:hypothetical protein
MKICGIKAWLGLKSLVVVVVEDMWDKGQNV